uniref:Thrombomodulin n=1 Tax=Erpetoichthys calabaricus TaxID=27687 RepID=A0A8C4SZ19_ERPCA
MTVRSTVQRDIISILNDNLQGRFWIGLELPAGRCSDPSKELHGYRWVTGEETTDFTEWRAQNSSECGRRCVSVSKDQLWEESSCLEAADGFLCEYNFNETCQAPEMEGFSFTYHTPLGFQATDTAHLPPGTVAIMSPAGYKLYCDINEWKPGPWDCQHENGGCSHTCDMEGGNGKCICPEGLQLEKNQVTCEAPDPCRSHHCAQVCVPQKDSYSCLCRGGYDLDQDGLTCVDVDECKQERACKSDQLCVNTPGSFTCVCPSGFEMVDGECEDTDECESTPCEHHCTNTHGGFECSCFEGFRLNEYDKTTCYSVCEEETCEAMCDPNNRDVCECPEGYILHMEEDTNVCIDIDECDMEMFCQQLCKNSFGSYTCYCEDGYKLEADNYTCTEVPDTEDGCSHKCEMERTKAKCFCPEGLQLEENQVTCETPDPCRDHPCEHLCLPQMDRYLCTCREGYRLGDDGSTCLDVDECQLARVCEAGQVCANTPGSFQCACPAGYRMVSGRCEDRDECEAAPCEHECANTPGSFDCYCLEGFRQNKFEPTKCDEVCQSEMCTATCDPNNEDTCDCPEGYVLDNEGTNQVCVDIDECDSGTFYTRKWTPLYICANVGIILGGETHP